VILLKALIGLELIARFLGNAYEIIKYKLKHMIKARKFCGKNENHMRNGLTIQGAKNYIKCNEQIRPTSFV